MNPRNVVFVTTALLGLVADQASKEWVSTHLEPVSDEISIIPGWFSIVHAHNTGAAFSTMEGQLNLFIVFTLIAVVVILELVRRLERTDRFVPMVLGMIFAGAVGNGIDRLRHGYVVDFLKVFAGHEPLRSWFTDSWVHTNVWPIFNIADSMLVVGVSLFLLYWAVQREGDIADEEETTPKAA